MKYLIYPTILFMMGMLTACSDDAVESMDENISQEQKTEIAFTLSAPSNSPMTRADGDPTTHGFATATDIVARYESYKASAVNAQPDDNAEKRTTRTVLHAQATVAGYSEVDYLNPTDHRRYWDDAYSRLAYISVYAVAVPGKGYNLQNNGNYLLNLVHQAPEAVSTTNIYWKKDDNATNANDIAWTVSTTAQTTETLENEDLCYSNNIQSTGENGRYVWDFTASKYMPDKTGATTHSDGQMRIALQNATDKTSTGHFDRGHLVFNHALTRMTVNLKKGEGFKLGTQAAGDNPGIPADPFAFASGTNVKIIGVPTASTLNFKTGVWKATPTTGDIAKMNKLATASTGYDYTLQSQFIPGFKFNKDSNTPVLEYTIDDNVYKVTEGEIYKALENKKYEDNTPLASDNKIEMKQGKNYVINIAVNKTAIATVTATLVNWEEINTDEIAPKNDYITINNMMGPTSQHCDNFDLYRVDDPVTNPYTTGDVPVNKNWFKHYTDKATLSASGTANVWKTNWYWESNKSFYHFRTVNKGVVIQPGTEPTDPSDVTNPKDYFNVTSGQLVDNKTVTGYNDYHWGAPMNTGATMKYDETKGFEDFLYPAIGVTKSSIDIIEHHIMSNVHIVLHTETKQDNVNHKLIPADNGVYLSNSSGKTTVELNRFYKNGTVEMARGVVDAVASSESLTASAAINAPATYYPKKDITIGETTYNVDDVGVTNKYSYRMVPQSLNRGSAPTDADKIGLSITTPDGNKYFVPELAIIQAVTGTNTQHHQAGEAVTRWYPGYDYTYHIQLHKTGIESITCSIVDWIKVDTGNIDIGL